MDVIKSIAYRSERMHRRLRSFFLGTLGGAEHVGRRSVGRRLSTEGRSIYRKRFARTTEGKAALELELLARRTFYDSPWMTPICESGADWVTMPLLPEASRLDRIAPTLPTETHREIAAQALRALLDMLVKGYAHRDFHGQNAFWLEGQLLIVDFEAMERYPIGQRPPLSQCYDLTGQGLTTPHNTGQQCYTKKSAVSLERLLGVAAQEALEMLTDELKSELQTASLSFNSNGRRHRCKAERIYNSFALPALSVSPDEAQRDSARRLERFGISASQIQQKAVLDLGSNIGGILFELQKWRPASCVGVEYDDEKVQIANRVAAFSGLNGIQFMNGDIDDLENCQFTGPFDAIFCLSIIEHVKSKERLYKALGRLARDIVFFEGNATTNPDDVRAGLLGSGFREVEFLGMSDDDCRPENNCRPLFRAQK